MVVNSFLGSQRLICTYDLWRAITRLITCSPIKLLNIAIKNMCIVSIQPYFVSIPFVGSIFYSLYHFFPANYVQLPFHSSIAPKNSNDGLFSL
jgi:hypothetical protein